MEHQVTADYTNVKSNVNVKVFVRGRPPDVNWQPPEDESDGIVPPSPGALLQSRGGQGAAAVVTASTLAGLPSQQSASGVQTLERDPSFVEVFPHDPKKIAMKDISSNNKNYGSHNFSFDHVFWTQTSQQDLFDGMCKPQVQQVLGGFSACCFAYGQTGSGKTHSMFGQGGGEGRGMIPRCMEEMLEQLSRKSAEKDYAVVVSFLEIYCDQIRDLGEAYLCDHAGEDGLAKTSDIYNAMDAVRKETMSRGGAKLGSTVSAHHQQLLEKYPSMDLKIHEDAEGNVFVKDLTLIPVNNLEQVLEVINNGLKLRATHGTHMNEVSSRSHTVFTATVAQRDRRTGEATTGILHLIDLAGSERLKKSASEGQRRKEALHINSSLTALGKVVMALDPAAGQQHVPYRDSKLTRLLQNSIGGNSFTTVLACIHPVIHFADECLSTLQFANRCRSVQNQPRINYAGGSAAEKDRKLKKMTEELAVLRAALEDAEMNGGGGGWTSAKVLELLSAAGIEGAKSLPDGSIRLPGGKVVAGAPRRSGGRRSSFLGGMLLGGGQGVDDMSRWVAELQHERKLLKDKLANRKTELENASAALREQRASLAALQRKSKITEKGLQFQVEDLERRMKELTETAAASMGTQIEAVTSHNLRLLEQAESRRHEAVIVSLQATKATSATKSAVEELRTEFREQLYALERGKAVEVELVQQRCDQAVEAIQMEMRELSKSTEDYRERKNALLKELEEELVSLFELASSQSCIGSLQPYKGHSALEDPDAFPHGRKLYMRKVHTSSAGPQIRKDARAARPSSAIARSKRPLREGSGLLPSTTHRSMRSAPSRCRPSSAPAPTKHTLDQKVYATQSQEFSKQETKHADAAMQPSMEYVRQLEHECRKAHQAVLEQSQRYNSLKVAHASLSRRVDKLQESASRRRVNAEGGPLGTVWSQTLLQQTIA